MPLNGQLVADLIVEFICNKVLANTETICLVAAVAVVDAVVVAVSALSLFAPTSFVFHFDYIVAQASESVCGQVRILLYRRVSMYVCNVQLWLHVN